MGRDEDPSGPTVVYRSVVRFPLDALKRQNARAVQAVTSLRLDNMDTRETTIDACRSEIPPADLRPCTRTDVRNVPGESFGWDTTEAIAGFFDGTWPRYDGTILFLNRNQTEDNAAAFEAGASRLQLKYQRYPTGITTTFTTAVFPGFAELTLHVIPTAAEWGQQVYDVELFAAEQLPPWRNIVGLTAPAGWTWNELADWSCLSGALPIRSDGIRFATTTSPLALGVDSAFSLRFEADAVPDLVVVHYSSRSAGYTGSGRSVQTTTRETETATATTEAPTPTPTRAPTVVPPTPTGSPTPTRSATPTPTRSGSPSPTATAAPVPTERPLRDTALEPEQNPATACQLDVAHFGGITAVQADICPECCDIDVGDTGAALGSGVGMYLHNGETYYTHVDLEIPGRGIDFRFERKYRSGNHFATAMGYGWDHGYDGRLQVVTGGNAAQFADAVDAPLQAGDVVRFDGFGRMDAYHKSGDGFEAPEGFYTRLTRQPDGSFEERDFRGVTARYDPPGSGGQAYLTRLSDRHGNKLEIKRDFRGRVDLVIDTYGREIDFDYDASGRLARLVDFTGRQVTYTYNDQGDLVAVTSPAVTGLLNGNNFPNGKTTRFAYTSGQADPALNHNLAAITAPNEAAVGGLPRVRITYDQDRVTAMTIGGTNASRVPAGGTMTYAYRQLADPATAAPNVPVSEVDVRDRNGNRTVYQLNARGNIVTKREYSNRDIRPGDRDYFETQYEYNDDGELVKQIFPEGNWEESTYDDGNSSRFQQGNSVAEVRRPDARRGGDQAFLKSSRTFEPIYNQVRTATDPRGHDRIYRPPIQLQGEQYPNPGRYTTAYTYDYQEGEDYAGLAVALGTTEDEVRARLAAAGVPMGLGDVNGDGVTTDIAGDVVRVERPAVHLRKPCPGDEVPETDTDCSLQARREGRPVLDKDGKPLYVVQPSVELYGYNARGQRLFTMDAEGNVTVFEYHPENNPGGGEHNPPIPGMSNDPYGYLKAEVRDVGEYRIYLPGLTNGVPIPTAATSGGGSREGLASAWEAAAGWLGLEGVAADDATAVRRIPEASPRRNSGTGTDIAKIRQEFEYDRVGNVVRAVDGRGVATDFKVNQLNQVVQVVRAAAHGLYGTQTDPSELEALIDFKYLENTFYDANDNVVLRQVEDRGNTSRVDGSPPAADLPAGVVDPDRLGDVGVGMGTAYVDTVAKYDILDQQIAVVQEVENNGSPNFIRTGYRYDPGGNQVLEVLPEGNANGAVYDERDLLFQSIRGLEARPAAGLYAPGDPTTFDRGGSSVAFAPPSEGTFNYDGNRNPVEAVDAADTDASAGNGSTLAGTGDVTRTEFDGYDRRVRIVDAVGGRAESHYDPAGNTVKVSRFGTVGGPSPRDNSGARNVLLEDTEYDVDERNRVFQEDRRLFVPQGVVTQRPPQLTEGPLTPGNNPLTKGDGWITSRREHDRADRLRFTTIDAGHSRRMDYDGAGRAVRAIDAEGNVVETAYDGAGNVIETRELDVAQVPGVAAEAFLTTLFHDSLGRTTRRVDNLGQANDYRYDSRGNLVAVADARGPDAPGAESGAVIRRRAFAPGARTKNVTNRLGNVTMYSYDGLSRQTRQEIILTQTGTGDGAHIGADVYGVKGATPPADVTQARDGKISIRTDWDRNSQQWQLTDDNDNTTRYGYDNQERQASETKGICQPGIPGIACEQKPTTISHVFDLDSNVARTIDENGTETVCDFDALNLRTACRVNRAPGVVGTTRVTYEYEGRSLLTRGTDNNDPDEAGDDSVITFAYESLGRLLEETQQISALPAKAISSGWNADDHRTSLIYPNDRVVTFTYDDMDRIDIIADETTPAEISPPDPNTATHIADYDYIGPGRVLERRYPQNGTRMTFMNEAGTADEGYDGVRRPIQLRHLRADNSLIVGFTHDYDGEGNKLNEVKLHSPENSEWYTYDSASRLVGFERHTPPALNARSAPLIGARTSGLPTADTPASLDDLAPTVPPLHSKWTLDGVGNWPEVEGAGAETRVHSSFNELIERKPKHTPEPGPEHCPAVLPPDGTIHIRYDDNGNMTDDGTFLFAWDYRSRMSTVICKASGERVGTYAYDAVGRRARKVVTNAGLLDGMTDFYLDGWREIEERDGGDHVTQQYVFGATYIDEALVMDRNLGGGDASAIGVGDQRLWYHQNTLFSVIALTDSAARLIETLQYDAYGDISIVTAVDTSNAVQDQSSRLFQMRNPFLYTGQVLDFETMSYQFRSRYYHTTLGRFEQRDHLVSLGNSELYQYTDSDPVNSTDPMGLFQEPIFNNCNEGQKTALRNALKNAEERVKKAIEQINNLKETSKAEFSYWFGECSDNKVKNVKDKYQKLLTSLENDRFTFCCCGEELWVRAKVDPEDPNLRVNIGPSFFTPNTETETDFGTIIHEVSHFASKDKKGKDSGRLGTRDFPYDLLEKAPEGWDKRCWAAAEFVKRNTDAATNCASNLEYYVVMLGTELPKHAQPRRESK